MDAGGAEKALINLLHLLENEHYEIDLVLFQKKGLFLSQLPESVRLIDIPGDYYNFTKSFPKSLVTLIFKGKFKLAIDRIYYSMVLRKEKNTAVAEQKAWKYLSKSIRVLDGVYDAAIGFLEKSSIYYVVDKVNAKNKIGWIHNDYQKLRQDRSLDSPYFEKLNKIVTVSELCLQSLNDCFPEYISKTFFLENVISKDWMLEQAEKEKPGFDPNFINFLSIGRLSWQKGFDIGIKAFSLIAPDRLKQIKWYIIGKGEDEKKLSELIKKYKLNETVFLVGLKSNPYPWLKFCNIYFQPSRFEGKSIAIDEAKLLNKPILAADFSTVNDQLTHLENAFISKTDENSIAEAIEYLLGHKELRDKFVKNLEDFQIDENQILNKFKNLING